MVKVLVADPSKTQTLNFCEYLSNNDKEFKVFGTNTGISTLNTYLEIKPDIFVLSPNFNDISGIEIIDRLSLFMDEKRKCNTIITANDITELSSISNVAKVYQIVRQASYQDLLTIIHKMCLENKFPELDLSILEDYLFDLGFHLKSNGTDYIESAIQLCFYFPQYLASLDSIFEYISKEFSTTTYNVKNAMRSALKPLNNYLVAYTFAQNSMYNLFNKNINVTPKMFIAKSVIYFRRKLKK